MKNRNTSVPKRKQITVKGYTGFDFTKYFQIRNSLTVEEMFLLYNSLNNLVNSKVLYSKDMKPYKDLAKKIRGLLVK